MSDDLDANDDVAPPTTPLKEYQSFVDGLLGWPRVSVTSRWVREWGTNAPKTYQTPEEFNTQMRLFTPEQRQVVADLLQSEHDASIHDVLAYMNDKINVEGLRLVRNGVELAIEPYGTELYWDWHQRCRGGQWPVDE